MNIDAQFNLIAEEYDCNRRKFIPCFDDYYKNLTQFIISSIKKPKKVLDLGAGTGLLSYYWYVQLTRPLSSRHFLWTPVMRYKHNGLPLGFVLS